MLAIVVEVQLRRDARKRLTWPVYCDGRGWEGATVRSVGLNAVPTTWVLGRDGTLLTLNARGPGVAEAAIREALR